MDNTRDHKILFSEALKELVKFLKQRRLADVFRFVSFVAGESYGPHCHLRIELNYVKKGSCRILLEEESVSFQERDLMLIPSHVSHKFEAGKKGCTLMQLEFLPDIFWQVNSLQPLSAEQEDTSFASPLRSLSEQKRLLKIEDDLRIVQEIRSIINELQQQEEGYEYLVVLSYVELMVLIYRYVSHHAFPPDMNSILQEAVMYLRQHYSADVAMADVAAHTRVSERYLRKLFAREFHLSPLGYLQRIRIDKAVELLKNTELSVKEVAYLCGYHSPQYFAHVFKQYSGIRPQEIGRGRKQE